MGNTLDKPITEKQTETYVDEHEDRLVSWGVSSMQGWRISMEDAHIAQPIPNIIVVVEGTTTTTTLQLPHHYLVCVLDGHGGTFAATFVSQHLLSILCRQPSFLQYAQLVGRQVEDASSSKTKTKKKKQTKKKGKATDVAVLGALLRQALEDAFVETDRRLLETMMEKGLYQPPDTNAMNTRSSQDPSNNGEDDWKTSDLSVSEPTSTPPIESASGTTATAVLITPDWMVCANTGDSRAIISWGTLPQKGGCHVRPLSTDHKPDLPLERERIERANGMVNMGRVDGELAVSRALGDFDFKDYHHHYHDNKDPRVVAQSLKVSPFPEVIMLSRREDNTNLPSNSLLVVACDGIWDVLSNEECLQLINEIMVQEGESNLGLVAEEVLDTCLKKGSRDNMTMIVVQLLVPGSSGQQLQQLQGKGGGVAKRRRQRALQHH